MRSAGTVSQRGPVQATAGQHKVRTGDWGNDQGILGYGLAHVSQKVPLTCG